MLTDGEFWTDEALKNRLAKDNGVLGIGTECYGPIKGEIEFLKEAPTMVDLSKIDHVVEGDLNINSGIIQIQDCPSGHVEFEKQITPGNYRIRVYSSNLASVDGDEGNDYYRIEVWSDNPQDSKLLKEYKK
ncbi:MAG: hypothetical protein COW65_04855 [Cytophagales bacterium CG18_big_fil_WC_8_21_14_2_50_42_9]|nr:MAG: hypothetical protein COW65_04855 [Cytophagales bacterium CG18_big_fil_WC_8_21_14_2_50_42_9]